jgi:hypothetical protein
LQCLQVVTVTKANRDALVEELVTKLRQRLSQLPASSSASLVATPALPHSLATGAVNSSSGPASSNPRSPSDSAPAVGAAPSRPARAQQADEEAASAAEGPGSAAVVAAARGKRPASAVAGGLHRSGGGRGGWGQPAGLGATATHVGGSRSGPGPRATATDAAVSSGADPHHSPLAWDFPGLAGGAAAPQQRAPAPSAARAPVTAATAAAARLAAPWSARKVAARACCSWAS